MRAWMVRRRSPLVVPLVAALSLIRAAAEPRADLLHVQQDSHAALFADS
jgi:hypothetical protein